MTIQSEAKAKVGAALAAAGVKYGSLSARAVGFQDLARSSAVFVTVNNWQQFDAATYQAMRGKFQGSGIVLQVTRD